MGQTGVDLLPVVRGDCWRIRVGWPNGRVLYVARFGTEREAIEWIKAHAWLASQVEESMENRGRGRPRKNEIAETVNDSSECS